MLGAVLCALASPLTAHAQTATGQAAGGTAGPGDEQPVPPAAPVVASPQLVEARQHIASGEAFLTAENYDAALVEFQRAYDLLEGNPIRFIVLFNIGQCHERMFRYDLALEFYRRYLSEGGDNAEDRATVEATIRALEGLLATLVITTNVPNAEVWVDDRQVATLSADDREVRIPGGVHTVQLRLRGYAPEQQQVQVAARSRTEVTFTLARLSDEYKGIDPWLFWTSGGVSVACAIGGAIVGVLALTESQSLQARANDLSNPDRFLITAADNDRVKTLALTADILFGSALLFGATAFTLAFLTNWESGTPNADGAPPATAARLRVTPAIGATSAGVSVSGVF
jgi:tetratricopeptide (TPR) repeat protein